MHQKERLDAIMQIMKQYQYVTVKFLMDELHYSSATINRDLNILTNQKLIKRSYGAAELDETKTIPLMFRYHKMKAEKHRIAKKTAEFIDDGDTVFISGGSTTQCIGQYILNKKNITVITNDMYLVSFLNENSIDAICLGGKVSESPNILAGTETVESASHYLADKYFFSSVGMNENGDLVGIGTYYLLDRIMLKNSKKSYCLLDHGKFGVDASMVYCTLDEIDGLISDFTVPHKIRINYPNTLFFSV